MTELRKDPIIGRWVIISTERSRRPSDFAIEDFSQVEGETCFFCEGNEAMTPPEVLSHRTDGTEPNTPGWRIRVVPNKFPALRIENSLQKKTEGIYDTMRGTGAHEVIIEVPQHIDEVLSLEKEIVEEVILVYRKRMIDLMRDPRFQYVLIFKNKGEAAGASLNHSHSQLIATPVVPKRVEEELEGSKKYFHSKGRCAFCDIIKQELSSGKRVLWEDESFVSLCPFASRFPYEMSILPKRHTSDFKEIKQAEVRGLALVLKRCIGSLNEILPGSPYNYFIHTSPSAHPDLDYYHWHLEIVPRLTRIAGFEWGTGFYINYLSPEQATRHLKGGKMLKDEG